MTALLVMETGRLWADMSMTHEEAEPCFDSGWYTESHVVLP